jgi:hypothetical protein
MIKRSDSDSSFVTSVPIAERYTRPPISLHCSVPRLIHPLVTPVCISLFHNEKDPTVGKVRPCIVNNNIERVFLFKDLGFLLDHHHNFNRHFFMYEYLQKCRVDLNIYWVLE